MKNYWVVTSNFFPLWAGPSERFFRYSKLSESKGLKLTFKTFDRGVNKDHEIVEGTDVFRYKTDNMKELLNIVVSEIEKGNKPNAVILLGLDRQVPSFNRLIRKHGVKSIYVSTMDFDLDYRDNGQKRDPIRRFLFVKLFKKMVDSFDMIVSSSQFLSHRYHQSLGIKSNKLHVIPNGVNASIFKPEPKLKNVYRDELGIPENETVFLFVGLMIERKGVLSLLKAWKDYKLSGGKGFLALVGDEKRYDSDESFYNEYSQLKSLLESDEYNAKFFGPSSEVHKFFKVSDVFLFMSYLEGMPNVLLEAMACGMPVVLNKFKGFSDDYGQDGEHFVSVEVQQQEQITFVIQDLANDPEKRERIGMAAMNRIQENFLVEDSMLKYSKLI